QAEDGIRDDLVTGVQTCALPICSCMAKALDGSLPFNRTFFLSTEGMLRHISTSPAQEFAVGTEMGILHRLKNEFADRSFYPVNRSEARRVGNVWRSRWSCAYVAV